MDVDFGGSDITVIADVLNWEECGEESFSHSLSGDLPGHNNIKIKIIIIIQFKVHSLSGDLPGHAGLLVLDPGQPRLPAPVLIITMIITIGCPNNGSGASRKQAMLAITPMKGISVG